MKKTCLMPAAHLKPQARQKDLLTQNFIMVMLVLGSSFCAMK